MAISATDSVFKAIVLVIKFVALPVDFGYMTVGQKQTVLLRASRRGASPPIIMISNLDIQGGPKNGPFLACDCEAVTHAIAIDVCPSVCPSVCQTRGL